MIPANTDELVQGYLHAFAAADVEGCVAYFHDDATIEWMMTTYRGSEAIEEWHKDRFASGLQIDRVDEITVDGDAVVIDITVSSKRVWRLASLGARVRIAHSNNKIQNARFSLRAMG